jgi:hypothetical protein
MKISVLGRAFVLMFAIGISLSAEAFVKEVVGVLPRPDVKFSGDIEMTFMSGFLAASGTILDTMPNVSHCLSFRAEFCDDFFIDGYGWFISSLHNRQHEDHRMLFNEFEGTLRFGHDLRFDKGKVLESKGGVLWNPPIGYYDSKMNYWGPYFAQYFKNDLIIPYWDGFWMAYPRKRARIRMGVRKPVKFSENFSITPFFETVWMDKRRFSSRYNEEIAEYSVLGGVFGTITFGFSAIYKFNDEWSLVGSFSQFDIINSQARRSVKRSDRYWAKCDWPIFKIGIRYNF